MKLDFNQKDFGTRLPYGKSLAVVESVISKRSDKTQKEYLEINFKGIGRYAGQTAREVFGLGDDIRWKLATLFIAAGFTQEYLVATGADTNDLIGRRVVIDTIKKGVKVVNGKEYTDIQRNYYTPEEHHNLSPEIPMPIEAEMGIGLESAQPVTGNDIPF